MIITLKELREELDALLELGVREDADVFIETENGDTYRIFQIDDENAERDSNRPSTTVILCAEYQQPINDLSTIPTKGNA